MLQVHLSDTWSTVKLFDAQKYEECSFTLTGAYLLALYWHQLSLQASDSLL